MKMVTVFRWFLTMVMLHMVFREGVFTSCALFLVFIALEIIALWMIHVTKILNELNQPTPSGEKES